jgi:hypothetical protein
MKSSSKQFSCDCGCGQKIKVIIDSFGKLHSIDIGFMKKGERIPKVGVVLRSDGKLKEFKNLIKINDQNPSI